MVGKRNLSNKRSKRNKRTQKRSKKNRSKKNRSHKRNIKRSRNKKNIKRGGNNLVEQRDHFDCALATLAMLTGTQYDILKEKYFKNHDFSKYGVKRGTEVSVLKKEGYKTCFFDKLSKKKAIITVPSLNYDNSNHDLFWDGSKILDPNIGNKKKDQNVKLYNTSDVLSGNVRLIEILGIC
jgi:hypothetical protein